VSSEDERAWRFEARFTAATDLREPRLLSLGGTLHLYMARLGTERLSFDPRGMWRSERRADGTWTDPVMFHREGFIPWRARVERGTPYLMAYVGGEHIYRFDGLPLEVEFLTTRDGRTWSPVDAARPVVYRGGGSESDFTLGDDGTLYAVIRNEAGDATGFGSKVCRAPAGDLANWTCRSDPRKYDSPWMFWHDGEAYLVGRRNVTDTGNYDLRMTGIEMAGQAGINQYRYAINRKRCSLWRYVQTEDRIAWILDLPSQGDTCFAAGFPSSTTGEWVVYNYSSPVDGDDPYWNRAQAGPTRIYRHVLRFARR